MSDQRAVGLLEVCLDRTGGKMLRAAQVSAFVIAWGAVEEKLCRRPTVAEYEEHWRESTRTAWRQLSHFRQAFPEYDTPTELIAVGHPAPARRAAEARTA